MRRNTKPNFNLTEPEIVQLVTTFHRRRYGRLMFSLDQPFPENPPKPEPTNIIQEALRAKVFMAENPKETYLSTAKKLDFHRKFISKMIKMIDMLPQNFIEKAKNCSDKQILRRINMTKINQILNHPCPQTIEKELNALLAN